MIRKELRRLFALSERLNKANDLTLSAQDPVFDKFNLAIVNIQIEIGEILRNEYPLMPEDLKILYDAIE